MKKRLVIFGLVALFSLFIVSFTSVRADVCSESFGCVRQCETDDYIDCQGELKEAIGQLLLLV